MSVGQAVLEVHYIGKITKYTKLSENVCTPIDLPHSTRLATMFDWQNVPAHHHANFFENASCSHSRKYYHYTSIGTGGVQVLYNRTPIRALKMTKDSLPDHEMAIALAEKLRNGSHPESTGSDAGKTVISSSDSGSLDVEDSGLSSNWLRELHGTDTPK